MAQRNSSQSPPPETRAFGRVPIAMAVALEVVAELRARERQSAEHITTEVLFAQVRRSRSR